MPSYFCKAHWLARQAAAKKAAAAAKAPVPVETKQAPVCRAVLTPSQTFPTRRHDDLVRQSADDLTCGLRALQNLYGPGFATRVEMDEHAKRLEANAHGETMYHAELGFYSIEVLLGILQEKGKRAQQIAIQKLDPEYYVPAVALGHAFAGYIATVGDDDVKHYLAIKYQGGRYRKIDSMPGVRPVDIEVHALFQKRSNGRVYCTMDASDQTPVVSLLAVGSSPFVEYQLLHDTWSDTPLQVDEYLRTITTVCHGKHRDTLARLRELPSTMRTEVLAWYRQKHRPPTELAWQGLQALVQQTNVREETILVSLHAPGHADTVQTAIRCSTMEALLDALRGMGWIQESFFLTKADKTPVLDQRGEEVGRDSEGSLEAFGVSSQTPLHVFIESDMAPMASVGGFYTFKTTVDGECVSTQHNAYSVRDEQGKVHVVYKHVVDSITPTR